MWRLHIDATERLANALAPRLPQSGRARIVRVVDERDPPREPQQLAAMRGRLEPTRGLYDLRHRNVELDRDCRRREHVREVSESEQWGLKRRATHRRLELSRGTSETTVFDVRRLDVGVDVNTKRHDLANEPLRA